MMDLSDFISETIAEITTGLLAGQQRVAAHGVDIKTAGGDQGDITNQPANNYTYNDIGQLTGNKQDGHYFRYNVTGKVTGVYGDANHTSPIAAYAYDDCGFRIKKTDPKTITHYVRDAAGSILAVYQNGALTELPVYGAGRLGVAYKNGGTLTYTYELSDHLGNVRAVVQKKSNTADITNAADYYPGGMSMANRILIGGQKYRFGYQGQFAEKDDETGYYTFQLRQYDSRIMRWLTPDPYGQYFSPYMSMGNSWANKWDRDGGCDDDDCSHYGTTLPAVTIWGINGKKSPIVNAEVDEDWVNPRLVNSSFTGTLEEWNEKHGLPRNTNFQAAYQHYLQLKIDRETQEMIRSIHQGQANFARQSVLLTAHVSDVFGSVFIGSAYVTAFVPGAQPVAAGLIAVGDAFLLAGTTLQVAVDIHDRNWTNVAVHGSVGYGSLVVGQLGKLGIKKLLPNNNATDAYIKTFIESRISTYTNAGGAATNYWYENKK